MIIDSITQITDPLEGNIITEFKGTYNGMPFQYFEDGTQTEIHDENEVIRIANENRELHNKIQVAPDFQIASPEYPKSKKEAEDSLIKYKDKVDKGEVKSLGEAVQALIYLYLNK